MKVLKTILRVIAAILSAAVLAAGISSLTEQGGGETLFSFRFLRLTVTGIGWALSYLVILLFATIRLSGLRSRGSSTGGIGERLDAFGFGLLPGAAVWKLFEMNTTLGRGKEVYDPLPELPLFTAKGCFAPSWIELVCCLICFAVILAWLAVRRQELAGNGDLMMTVVIVWGLFRAFTETFRAEPFAAAGSFNITQIILFALADICLAVWTVRKERTQKSTAFAVLEWIAVLACETAEVLTDGGILSAGSRIGDLAVTAGCTILCTLLMLLAGKDSREENAFIAGSDNPVYGS